MSSQTFSEMCEESAVRLYLKQSGLDDDAIDDYLEHHGIKGMKWGIRRFQNPDGTLTAAGKERYRSIYAGGKGKASEEFYRKAVAKDSAENFKDLASSLPMQHVLSKLRQDSRTAFTAQRDENLERARLVTDGYNKLSQKEKDEFVNKAIQAAEKYYSEGRFEGMHVDGAEEVKSKTDLFDNEYSGNGYVDSWTMTSEERGFLFTGYGQWYLANKNQIEATLKPLVDRSNATYDQMSKNCTEYVKEFTSGFGELQLKDLTKEYGMPYTVNDRLGAIASQELFNRNIEYGMLSVEPGWTETQLADIERGLVKYYDKWRKEAYKKNNMTKYY